jgi:hypothetical protein
MFQTNLDSQAEGSQYEDIQDKMNLEKNVLIVMKHLIALSH